MADGVMKTRLMKADDFDAVVAIDMRVLGTARPDYYEMRFEKLFGSRYYLPASLVTETEDGTVVGFVMGEIYMGQYGIFQEEATLDTIGVDPDYQKLGIGERLINEFVEHLKTLGVRRIHTLVGLDDPKLMRFFNSNQFGPSSTIALERAL